MKKISSTLKNSAEFVPRPFALLDHDHADYVPLDGDPVTIVTDVIFAGDVSGIDTSQPTIVVGETVSALRMVSTDDDGLGYYSDPTDPDSVRRIVGLSISAGTIGLAVTMLREGRHQDPSWSWDVTKQLYLSSVGTITQVAPTTGISVVLGHAQTADTIFLNIETPIILA